MFTVEKFENAEKFMTKRKSLFVCCLYFQDFPMFKKYTKPLNIDLTIFLLFPIYFTYIYIYIYSI